MRLVAPFEIPAGIGLIEYNKYKFGIEPSEDKVHRPFRISGLKVVKIPRFRQIPRFQIDHSIVSLAENLSDQIKDKNRREIMNGTNTDDKNLYMH
jgi:hypothetical protein